MKEIFFLYPKKHLSMLVYQVEVIMFSKQFLQKMVSSIQSYLFASVFKVNKPFFLPLSKINVRK